MKPRWFHTFQSLTMRSFVASMSRELLLGRAHHLTFLIFSLTSKLCITSNCTGRDHWIKRSTAENACTRVYTLHPAARSSEQQPDRWLTSGSWLWNSVA